MLNFFYYFRNFAAKTLPSTSEETTDERSTKTDNSEPSSRILSPKNARLSTSALTEDETGSDRFSISDDDDISADEEDNKIVDKDRRSANKQNNNNNNIQATSKQEEELLRSTKLTPDQIREIKEAFHVFDNNGDGCITATELKKLVTSLGYNITEAELMDMMNQIGEPYMKPTVFSAQLLMATSQRGTFLMVDILCYLTIMRSKVAKFWWSFFF